MKKQNQFCTLNLVENDDIYMLTWTIRGDSPLKSNDVRGFEKFADLVRISVVKLQADGRDGELGEGTLHGTLVKKLGERQAESYSRWLRENKKERSVVNFNEWLKEEVRVRVETKEMMYGVEVAESRQNENLSISGRKHEHGDRGRSHSFYTGGAAGGSKETKPLCGFCEGNHGVWSCKRFQALDVKERWNVAKCRRLCLRYLDSFHQGRVCPRSKPRNVNRCTKKHHNRLHDTKMEAKQPKKKRQIKNNLISSCQFPHGSGQYLTYVLMLQTARERDRRWFC